MLLKEGLYGEQYWIVYIAARGLGGILVRLMGHWGWSMEKYHKGLGKFSRYARF
jgi:hypothetical protein